MIQEESCVWRSVNKSDIVGKKRGMLKVNRVYEN